MAIPFLSYFKKKAKAEPASAPVPSKKKSSDRLSKTVMPNALRNIPPEPASAPATVYAQTAVAPEPARTPVIPRTVAFSNLPHARVSSSLPPAVALALEPNVERTISIDLADVVSQMPAGLVRPLENGDAERRVLLKASELERGMANGRPTVSVESIYRQMPEIFSRDIAPGDASQIALPFQAVLEQFSKLQTRSDQQRATRAPQVQTPFLKVTQEDGERFGTPTDIGELVDPPTVRVEPATAESIAAAEPEPAPTRIPFRLTPNATDALARERVPASSEPSFSIPPPAAPARPMRIPFKITAPSEAARAKPEPWPMKKSLAMETAATAEPTVFKRDGDCDVPTITLPLKPILEILPPMQLTGSLDDVPSDARVDFPFSLVSPQLVTGRVTIQPDQFAAALPPQYSSVFNSSAAGDPVALPLQEVLKNLPAASLRMRDDQEEQEKGADFETPFSAKAAEDAKRFKVAATPVAQASVVQSTGAAAAARSVATIEEVPVVAITPAETESAPAMRIVPVRVIEAAKPRERNVLQMALDTDETLDAKAVVAHIGKLDGVEACAIMFSDGLSLAGDMPERYEADGLCAMAPSLLRRVENHMVETQLGALRAMTLSCAKGAITFFMHDHLCLAALHKNSELGPDIRDRLGRTVQELSRQYSHPA